MSLIFFSLPSQAQILNVESRRVHRIDTADLWTGSSAFTFNLRRQQVYVLQFNWNTSVAYLSRQHTWQMMKLINVINISDRDVISDAYVHGRVTFHRQRTLMTEAFSQYQYDKGRGLERRTLAGGGGRIRFIDKDKFVAYMGTGLMLEIEEWRSNVADRMSPVTSFYFIKSNSYVHVSWEINPVTNFHLTGYYQARPDFLGNPRIALDAAFSVKVSKQINFNTRLNGQYDEVPVVNTDPWNYLLTQGIQFTF